MNTTRLRPQHSRCRCLGLIFLAGLVQTPALSAPGVSVLHSFSAPLSQPTSTLLKATDGNYYGIANGGTGDYAGAYWSASGNGMVFKMTPAGVVTTLHFFNVKDGMAPVGDLIQGNDGNLYGTTQGGGTYGKGTVYKLTLGGALTTLHSFNGTDGNRPLGGVVQGLDGAFYGTTFTGNTVYKVTSAGVFTNLGTIDATANGVNPDGALALGDDGNFYGTTQNGNQSIFKVTPVGVMTNVTPLYGVGQDPFGTLIKGLDGKFYGTTEMGSAGGTVFSVTSTGTYATLHSFTTAEGFWLQSKLMQEPDGTLYGTAVGGGANNAGTVFKCTLDGQVTVLHSFDLTNHNSSYAACGLIDDGTGHLLGTVPNGGDYGKGYIFSVSTTGTDYSVVNSLKPPSAPYGPGYALVQGPDGFVYGTTALGGANDKGTVFKIDATGNLIIIHEFTGLDGASPDSALIFGPDGSLYGTCSTGTGIFGAIYKIDPTGVFSVLHQFNGADGNDPVGALAIDGSGNLYGTTYQGGANSFGTVYKLNTAGQLVILHSFAGTDGKSPVSGLVIDGAYLFGCTGSGGAKNFGTAFRITPTGTFATMHTFTGGSDGSGSMSAFTVGADGALYDTTIGPGNGTIFKLTTGGVYSIFHSFAADNISLPTARLVIGADGNFYGAALNGGIYSISPAGAFNMVTSLDGVSGAQPVGLCTLADGRFIITASSNGPLGGGSILRLALTAPSTPTGPTATALSTRVQLNWTASSAANRYNIYRSTVAGGEGANAYRTGISGTSFVDTGLTNGVHYYYKISAVNEAGESDLSTEASAAPKAATVVFVKTDTTTQGNWKGHYGADGHNVIGDTSGDNPHYRDYVSLTPGNHNSGVWMAMSTAPQCLQATATGSTNRVAGVWFNTTWSMNLSVTGGSHQLALYFLDFPNAGYAETITIKDAATGYVLDTRSISGFQAGQYEVWNVSGNVTITLTSTAGHWAPVSGIFFG